MIKIWKIQYDALEFRDIVHKDEDMRELIKSGSIDLDYTYNGERKRLLLDLKKGFRCDGASVPRIGYWVLKPWYDIFEHNLAAIIHDAIYVFGGNDCDKTMVEFHEANEIFRALLHYFKTVSEFKGSLAFAAVDSWIGKRCYKSTNTNDKFNYSKIEWGWI